MKTLIINGSILTLTSLVLRWIGLLFNTYLSNKLGSAGVGVYGLVQSVFGFAITFACSGVNLGTTRIISEAIAKENNINTRCAIKKSILYSLFFSSIAFIVLLFGSSFISSRFLGDTRSVNAIRILAFALPFISISSVINGYFTAVRKVYKNAIVSFAENLSQFFVTTRLIVCFSNGEIESVCSFVALGTVLSELISFVFNLLLFLYDSRKHADVSDISKGYTKKLINISLPVALTAYVRSGLITVEHLLIPYGLRKTGATFEKSMSVYGVVNSMVLPVILFPSCIIYSFSGLLVPEFAAMHELQNNEGISKAAERVLKYTLLYSVGVAGIFMCYAYEISYAFYNSAEAFAYIRIFAPLVVIMYLDGAIDGMLKGMNEQVHSMKVNIIDSLISVILVFFLVPKYQVNGYVFAVFVCEILNCSLSLMRLVSVCNIRSKAFLYSFKPILTIIISTVIVTQVFEVFGITVFNQKVNLILRITLTVIIYLLINKITTKNPILSNKERMGNFFD